MMRCHLEGTAELYPAFQSCIEREDYDEALQLCSEIELAIEDTDGYFHEASERMNFLCCYMAIFLITGDLNGARYLWRRLTPDFKLDHSELSHLWNIGKCLWQQDYINLKLNLDIPWSLNILPYVVKIKNSVHQRNLQQISSGYSVISLSSLTEKLMLTQAEVIDVCNSLKWIIDEQAEYVSPTAISISSKKDGERTYDKDIKAMLQLSSYVANLEKKNLKVDMNSGTGIGVGTMTNGPSTTTGNKKSNIHNP